MERWIAGFLQAGAAFLFVYAGVQQEVVLLAPAAASGIGGLLLWGRSTRRASALPKPESATLEGQVARMEEMLISLQQDVGRLREDREFFQQLYAARVGEPLPLSSGSVEQGSASRG